MYFFQFCDSIKQKPLWFVFSGMGSQWVGMGKELMQIPIFANAIDKCDKVSTVQYQLTNSVVKSTFYK